MRSVGREGVGLLGIVLAALVMAILVPPIAGLFSSSYGTVVRSETAMLAAIAATDLYERAATPSFVKAHLGETLTVPGVPGLKLLEPFASAHKAKATLEIGRATGHTNPATGRGETELYEVSVRMSWEEGPSRQTLETRTFVADLGPMGAP
jgi:hypothetical protein